VKNYQHTATEVVNTIFKLIELPGGQYLKKKDEAIATVKDLLVKNEILSELTDHHIDILKQIIQGKSAKQIAPEVHLSPRTVEAHIYTMKRIFGATNVAQMVCVAKDCNII
jgi:two-component system response regulator FixJ